MIAEFETTTRIHAPEDDPLNGTTAVRVCFNTWSEHGYPFGEPEIFGVFRLSNDAEIDLDSLSQDSQDLLTLACEEYIKKEQKKRHEIVK